MRMLSLPAIMAQSATRILWRAMIWKLMKRKIFWFQTKYFKHTSRSRRKSWHLNALLSTRNEETFYINQNVDKIKHMNFEFCWTYLLFTWYFASINKKCIKNLSALWCPHLMFAIYPGQAQFLSSFHIYTKWEVTQRAVQIEWNILLSVKSKCTPALTSQ